MPQGSFGGHMVPLRNPGSRDLIKVAVKVESELRCELRIDCRCKKKRCVLSERFRPMADL